MIIGGITMICPNCHNNNDNDSIYCKFCAYKLTETFGVVDINPSEQQLDSNDLDILPPEPEDKVTEDKPKNPNQAVNIKVSEDIKYDLTVFKRMVQVKYDYKAIAWLLEFWANHMPQDQKDLYENFRKLLRENG